MPPPALSFGNQGDTLGANFSRGLLWARAVHDSFAYAPAAHAGHLVRLASSAPPKRGGATAQHLEHAQLLESTIMTKKLESALRRVASILGLRKKPASSPPSSSSSSEHLTSGLQPHAPSTHYPFEPPATARGGGSPSSAFALSAAGLEAKAAQQGASSRMEPQSRMVLVDYAGMAAAAPPRAVASPVQQMNR